MTMEEKKEKAKGIYKKLECETDQFDISRVDELNADIFLPKDNQRGIGGVIIDDDGTYHICGSIHPLDYYIDEFKNGKRNMLN